MNATKETRKVEFQAFHSSHLTRSQLHQSIILDIIVLSFVFIHCILPFEPHQISSQSFGLCLTPYHIVAVFCTSFISHDMAWHGTITIHGYIPTSVIPFCRTSQIRQFQCAYDVRFVWSFPFALLAYFLSPLPFYLF